MVGKLKLDKKSLLRLAIIVVIAILICVGFFYYLSQIAEKEEGKESIKEERITEEILKQFEAPNVEGREIPKETLKQFEALNVEGKEIPEEILRQFGTFK